jgi:cardiolipin synthase
MLQEPIVLDYGPRDPAFASAYGPVVGAEFISGNAVKILVNGDEFFPAMLADIRRAQKTVTLETYIWAPGQISNDFITALTDSARRGVKVHVLVDGMGTLKFKREDADTLRSAGVEFVKYGRERWYDIKPNLNHRTHRKLLIVDGRIGYTGGMCIDDHWLGDAENEKVWRETGVRVEGPAVRQMQAVFATNWMQTTSHLLLGEDYFPKISHAGPIVAQCFQSGPAEAPEAARLGYLLAIAGARESIDIAHAYFVPDELAIDMLVAARQRGVKIRVIVPAINDSRMGRAASRSRWGRLLEAGAEFHLYEPAMYHCKTMSVDGLLVTIGSANFDNRSFAINDEVTFNTIDKGVAAAHLRMFENDLKRSRPYTHAEFEGRPFYVKTFDHLSGLFRSQF